MKSKTRLLTVAFAASLAAAMLPVRAAQVEVGVDLTGTSGPGLVSTGLYRWTKDNVYLLKKVVYVTGSSTLIIEPGTVIRGLRSGTTGINFSNQDQQPGSLVISRGSKIVANGTPQEPIIFTSVDDPYVPLGNVPASAGGNQILTYTDLTGTTRTVTFQNYSINGPIGTGTTVGTGSSNAFSIEGQWGGVIVLGRAKVAVNDLSISGSFYPANMLDTNPHVDPVAPSSTGQGAGQIEGLINSFPGYFGGDDNNDNSGIMRFCSHRFGGFVIGSNNEINGLTPGGVGKQSVIEWQEVINNQDDDFEPFGGTVDMRWLFGLYNGDDGIDYDNGYSGRIQFVYINKNNRMDRDSSFTTPLFTGRLTANAGDSLFELDGPEATISSSNDTGIHRPVNNGNIWNFSGIASSGTFVISGSNTARANGNTSALLARSGAGDNPDPPTSGPLTNPVYGTADFTTEHDPDPEVANSLIEANHFTNHIVRGATGQYNFPFRADQLVVADFSTLVSTVQSGVGLVGTVVSSTNQMVGDGRSGNNSLGTPYRLTKNEIDMRLLPGAISRTSPVTAPDDGFLAPVAFRAGFKDNNALKGWSILEDLEMLSTAANTPTPLVTLSRSGSNTAIISFSSVAGVQYLIETSVDGKSYSPIPGAASLKAPTATSTVTSATTSIPLTVGSPLYARVTAL